MDNKLPQAVIFDWDNTLVDTWPLIHFAINYTMEKMSKELWSLDRVKSDVHKSMRESFPAIFGDNWQEAGQIYISSYRSQHLENLQFLPGALQLIDFLLEQKIAIFLISNKIGETLRLEVNNLKMTDKFVAIIGSGDAKFDKPSVAPVELALRNTNLNPKQDLIWFVGDSVTDIECAINSSCQPVLYGPNMNVPQSLIDEQKVKEDKPMLCFQNHQEILGWMKSLCKIL